MTKTITVVVCKMIRKTYRLLSGTLEHLYYSFLLKKTQIDDFLLQNYFIPSDKSSIEEIANSYNRFFPENVRFKKKEADLICSHIFDLLGSGPKKISRDGEGYQGIDWHTDFKSGFRWEQQHFFRDIRFGHRKGIDIKTPWELSRFQHLSILGQAYLLTKDEKYTREYVDQLTDWIEHNRVGFGVNWVCTMDVAIRAVNWLVAREYFSESKEITQLFLWKMYSSLYEHGKFIWRHLEREPVKTNHYLSDIAGLFFISIYCPFFKESKKWQKFAVEELEKEIQHQIYDDGCDFEASTCYHRLALEIFMYCEMLGRKAGVEFQELYREKLKKMFEFCLSAIKPNGLIPQIGDNDSGRFLMFTKKPSLEHQYLFAVAAVLYRDPRFILNGFSFDEEAFWVYGTSGKKAYDRIASAREQRGIVSFPDAGWHIIRQEKDYCFISCGPNGQDGNGGHAHNDKLGFELMIDGQDIFVDPGSYSYTSYKEERNIFRSTRYHNTISFQGVEQNELDDQDIFSLLDKVKIEYAFLKEEGNKAVFNGKIKYADVIHKRTISLDRLNSFWEITDSITVGCSRLAAFTLHLSPYVVYKDGYIISKSTNNKLAIISSDKYKLEINECSYSPGYGIKIPAECLTVKLPAEKGISITLAVQIKKCSEKDTA
jgi:hypothetical protein